MVSSAEAPAALLVHVLCLRGVCLVVHELVGCVSACVFRGSDAGESYCLCLVHADLGCFLRAFHALWLPDFVIWGRIVGCTYTCTYIQQFRGFACDWALETW